MRMRIDAPLFDVSESYDDPILKAALEESKK
jgi:hypothetical protein